MYDRLPPPALMLADIEAEGKIDEFNQYAEEAGLSDGALALIALARFWVKLGIPF